MPAAVAFHILIDVTLGSLIGEPGLVRTRSTAAMICGSIVKQIADEIEGAGRGRLPMPRPGEVDMDAITSTLLLHASDLLRAHFRDQWLAAMQMLARKAKREVEMGWASEGQAGAS